MTKGMAAPRLALLAILGTSCSFILPQNRRPMELGFGDLCTPAVFLRFEKDLSATIYDVKYSPEGPLIGYTLSIQYSGGKPIVVTIASIDPVSSGEFVATIDGRKLASPKCEAWAKKSDEGLVDLSLLAFDPGKPGGVIRLVRGKRLENGSVQFTFSGTKETTEFSCRDGLRQLSGQQFQHEGKKYHIEYSQHTWSKVKGSSESSSEEAWSRPTGYTARIVGVSNAD
jgi:hypothetical protein